MNGGVSQSARVLADAERELRGAFADKLPPREPTRAQMHMAFLDGAIGYLSGIAEPSEFERGLLAAYKTARLSFAGEFSLPKSEWEQ